MLPRILMTGGRVAFSRPGHNVLTEPINYNTMALDSSFTNIERPLVAGVIRNQSVNQQPTVFYPLTYAREPFVFVNVASGGVVIGNPARENGGNWQVFFGINHYKHAFTITRPPQTLFTDTGWDAPLDWHYVVIAAT